MKKRIIVTAAITACLALWGAVWPQAETVGEPPASPQTPAVSAPEPIVTEVKLETEIDFPAEKEKAATPQPEPPHETTNESEPAPVEASAAPDTRPTSAPEPAPEPMPALAQVQAVTGRSPAIWSMWKASVGWSTKGQITANTARTFTKTATKLES